MKQSLQLILSSSKILIAISFLTACQSSLNTKSSNSYQIPWLTQAHNYELQTVQVSSLSDPEKLESSLVRVYVTPSETGGSLSAPSAIGRFMTRKDGVKIPLDFTSMQGATIHAHFERLIAFDRATGIDRHLEFPLKVAIETRMTGGETQNNAFFDGRRNAILILPFTDGGAEGLPISLNGGILAHEHFHAIFHNLVVKPVALTGANVSLKVTESFGSASAVADENEDSIPADASREERQRIIFNDFMLRAVNEGLADFWAWLYIGDVDFVGKSVAAFKTCRTLSREFVPMSSTQDLQVQVARLASLNHSTVELSYSLGTQYSRFLKEVIEAAYSNQLSYADRVEIASMLAQALQSYGQQVASEYSTKEISSDSIAQKIVESIPQNRLNKRACRLIAEFKVDGSSEQLRVEKCAGFSTSAGEITRERDRRKRDNPPFQFCDQPRNAVRAPEASP